MIRKFEWIRKLFQQKLPGEFTVSSNSCFDELISVKTLYTFYWKNNERNYSSSLNQEGSIPPIECCLALLRTKMNNWTSFRFFSDHQHLIVQFVAYCWKEYTGTVWGINKSNLRNNPTFIGGRTSRKYWPLINLGHVFVALKNWKNSIYAQTFKTTVIYSSDLFTHMSNICKPYSWL